MIFDIAPCPKPRMTQSDKWKKRPCVLRYRAFCDEARLKIQFLPLAPFHVTFIIPTTNKNRIGKPHRLKPDVDNLIKSLFDALCKDDSHIDDIRITKIWGEKGAIKIEPLS